jgi:endonuclease-3
MSEFLESRFREPTPELKARARQVLRVLKREYPEARCALNYSTPLELLVATILSAQCTDERVNKVTADLFRRYPGCADYAGAPLAELERAVHSTGFYRNKAKAIQAACRLLLERHGGEVPPRMEELLELPGVARKTANVVLGNAFGVASGVVVDTHVSRLAGRLGLSAETQPEKIERDLQALVPRREWVAFSHRLIAHGRGVCQARRPRCEACALEPSCPSSLLRPPAGAPAP